MGTDLETVETSVVKTIDPIFKKQQEDVAKMRASLLCCSDDPTTATAAMQNITVLRVYHQMARIIRYLEMMDKIEDKLYDSIDCALDRMSPENTSTLMMLITIQEKLQKNIIESHRLLQPYLNLDEFKITDLAPVTSSHSGSVSVIPRESRDKLRTSAQQVLEALDVPLEEVDDSD